MKIGLKIVWEVALVLVLLTAGFFTLRFLRPDLLGVKKTVQGQMISCWTDQPISGVEVEAVQTDWGISRNGHLVWDKRYFATAVSDSNGYFKMTYRASDHTQLNAIKAGYMHAQYTNIEPNMTVVFKMLEGDDRDVSNHDCTTGLR